MTGSISKLPNNGLNSTELPSNGHAYDNFETTTPLSPNTPKNSTFGRNVAIGTAAVGAGVGASTIMGNRGTTDDLGSNLLNQPDNTGSLLSGLGSPSSVNPLTLGPLPSSPLMNSGIAPLPLDNPQIDNNILAPFSLNNPQGGVTYEKIMAERQSDAQNIQDGYSRIVGGVPSSSNNNFGFGLNSNLMSGLNNDLVGGLNNNLVGGGMFGMGNPLTMLPLII